MFTLDALRGNPGTNNYSDARGPGGFAGSLAGPESAPRSLNGGFVVDDDEGIIDLNALASSPAGQRAVAAPLFSEPPPAAFAADVADGFGQSSIAMPGGFRLSKRAIAGIAAAGVALALCTVGIATAFRGEEPVARSAATTMILAPTALPTAAAPAAAAPAPAAPAADTTPASSDDDSKTAATTFKKGSKHYKSGGTKASYATKVATSSGGGAPLVSKAPKAVDKCGCKGDFNCTIRCSATGK